MSYPFKKLISEARGVASEARAHVPGMDFDDLTQEALMVMWLAVATSRVVGPKSSPAYLRESGRNRIRQIIRASRAEARHPFDAYGKPLAFVDLEDCAPSAFSYRMEVDMIDPPTVLIPPCHVRGEKPEGYDPADPLCHNCPDKFSCLVETEETDLNGATVEDDPEVALLVRAKEDHAALRIAYEVVTERQRRRIRLRALKEPVPAELAVNAPIVLPPAPAPVPPRARRYGASLGAPAPSERMPEPEGMPREKTLSLAELDLAIARIRIGQPFPLEIGHVLVRRRQGEDPDVCVEIREDGFWLNLNGRTYGSPSTAAKAAEIMLGASPKANRPANAYFSIVRNMNTEIRDAVSGAVLACRREVRV